MADNKAYFCSENCCLSPAPQPQSSCFHRKPMPSPGHGSSPPAVGTGPGCCGAKAMPGAPSTTQGNSTGRGPEKHRMEENRGGMDPDPWVHRGQLSAPKSIGASAQPLRPVPYEGPFVLQRCNACTGGLGKDTTEMGLLLD